MFSSDIIRALEMKTVFIKTFGCKVNYTESVAFSELLSEAGFFPREMVGSSLPEEVRDAAPIVFVNSCCVTQEAERKAAQFTRRIRREYPGSEVLFSGCGARNHLTKPRYEEAGARVFDFYTQAFEWLKSSSASLRACESEGRSGAQSPPEIGIDTGAPPVPPGLIGSADRRVRDSDSMTDTAVHPTETMAGAEAPPLNQDGPVRGPAPTQNVIETPATPFESGIVERARSRCFIKVQDGCHNCCTFCIIPFVRPYASRPIGEIIAEVDRRVDQGYCELVLTGINIGNYGKTPVDTLENIASDKHWKRGRLYQRAPGHPTFFDLVEAILDRLPDGVRLRISSIEPEHIEDRFFEQFKHPRMCPHLHLPLQSGSDEVLTDMRRLYCVDDYRSVAAKFRAACPTGALTTDILVGFPTETESHFQETLELCIELGFERVHGFPYSVRPGTRAARMKQLERQTIQARNRQLIGHCNSIAEQRWRRFIGSDCTVLIEEQHRGEWVGHGEAYQVVRLADVRGDVRQGSLVQVKLTSYGDGGFVGMVC